MSTTNAPYGFTPIWHPSGEIRARALPNGISAAYSTGILTNQPVLLNDGVLNPVTAGSSDFIGVFAGCSYTPTGGRPVWSPQWVASTSFVAGSLIAYYYEDPAIIYAVQCDGSLAQTSIGDQADISNFTAGSTVTGLSQATLSSTLVTAGSQGQWRIEGLHPVPGNDWGDTYTQVQVTVARSQYVSNKVAI